jgi:tRNA1Val (adenine37-N6)-methyltransferase
MSTSSEDGFLAGKLKIRQPRTGFRAGVDAVLLAAAVPAAQSNEVLELGAGVGTAALCLAHRVVGVRVLGVEIAQELVDIAKKNSETNALADRVTFAAADALALPAAMRRPFDHVFCNPPFYGPEGEVSPDPGRARAKMDGGRLADWLKAGLKRARSGGSFTAIVAADRLFESLSVLPAGGVTVFPLWPRAGAAAKRAILQVRIGARTPLRLLPGLILHAERGYTAEADAVLRGEAALSALAAKPSRK